MSNIIHAEERFSDKAMMESLDFKLWQYDRYWLGKDPATTARIWGDINAQCRQPPPTIAQIERMERLYTAWLIQRGDEVAGRR